MLSRKTQRDLADLLEDYVHTTRRRRWGAAGWMGAIIGGLAGASVGFVVSLLLFGWLGSDGQAGIGALLFGVPFGGWFGAVLGAREANR